MPQGEPDRTPLSSSLLVRLREGQPDAWERFLNLYGPLIYSWCRARWHLEPADAADILQEVAARVLEAIADYRGGNVIAWLQAITRSRVANFLKKNPNQAAGGSDALQRLAEIADYRAEQALATDDAAADETLNVEALGGVLLRAVDAVRARAAENSWQAFWQVTVQGRQPADVAADLGLSANAVYIANSRMLSRLRQELGDLEKGGPR